MFLVLPFLATAQDLSVRGKVIDSQNAPLSYVNVIIQKSADSSFVKGTSTDDYGEFQMESLSEGQYIMSFSFVGYSTLRFPLILNEDKNLQTVVLEEDVTSLNEINITVKKPVITKQADRLVFNIENTALVEGDMLQVLQSTPGVLVQDDGLTVKGENPTVYINNRRVQLTSQEVMQLLESSSANAIKSVEVITNPSAKYDAETGVVIHIIMSKNLVTGYRGNVSTAYTQAMFPRYDLGTSHFFKSDKLSFNLNYNYNRDKIGGNTDDIVNYINEDNQIYETSRSATERESKFDRHTANFNFDYFINDNNTLSLSSTLLYLPKFDYSIDNDTDIINAMDGSQSRFNSLNNLDDDKLNLGFDLNYRHQFTKGSLSFDAHYTYYDYQRYQSIESQFYDANDTPAGFSSFNTESGQDTDIITSKVDYTLPVNDTSTFETGIKFSSVNSKSALDFFDIDSGTGESSYNFENSDSFSYDELVYAAYANYTLSTEKWSMNLGLRAEQTNIEGNSLSTNQINTQDYLELFPNASLQYNISDNYNVYGSYKRSIERPNYSNLNPFRVYISENFEAVGNPNLQPRFMDHYIVGTTLFGNFVFEAYYQNKKGEIYQIPIQDNVNNLLIFTSINVDRIVEYGFDFQTWFDVNDWWSVYAVSSFYNIEESNDFGNATVTQSQWSNYSELSNDFSFLKDRSLNMSLSLIFVGKNQFGLRTVDDRLFSQLSISKSLFKKKASISLSAGDLFNMQDETSRVRYLNQFSSVYSNLDNRYVKLGFSYKFGNTKLKTNDRAFDKTERDRLKTTEN